MALCCEKAQESTFRSDPVERLSAGCDEAIKDLLDGEKDFPAGAVDRALAHLSMLAHGVVTGFDEAPFAPFDLRPQVVFEDAADSFQRGIVTGIERIALSQSAESSVNETEIPAVPAEADGMGSLLELPSQADCCGGHVVERVTRHAGSVH
jgi:hypothetical protein